MCDLCKSGDSFLKQKMYVFGIEKEINYCKKCAYDIFKNHMAKVSHYNNFFKNYETGFVNGDMKNLNMVNDIESIITELSVKDFSEIFEKDEFTYERMKKTVLERKLKYYAAMYEEENNTEEKIRIKKILKNLQNKI